LTITKANTHQTVSVILAHVPFDVIVVPAIAFYSIHFLLSWKSFSFSIQALLATMAQLISFEYSLPFDTAFNCTKQIS
jgi:hypothetical protein